MNAPILAPTNPMQPPAANDLLIDSLNGIPYNYRWCLRKGPDGNGAYINLQDDNGSMTDVQWAAWTTQPDTYVLQCAAVNLGVTLA